LSEIAFGHNGIILLKSLCNKFFYLIPLFTTAVDRNLSASIKIRDLSPDDAESVIKVAKESWIWTYSGIYTEEFINSWIRENYSRTRLLQQIARAQLRKDTFFLGAFDSSELVGFIHLKLSGSTAELLRLYLKPDYTRRKIGSKLLEEAETLMGRSGVSECILYVHRKNSVGMSFYRKKGFVLSGNNGEDLIMVKKYIT